MFTLRTSRDKRTGFATYGAGQERSIDSDSGGKTHTNDMWETETVAMVIKYANVRNNRYSYTMSQYLLYLDMHNP